MFTFTVPEHGHTFWGATTQLTSASYCWGETWVLKELGGIKLEGIKPIDLALVERCTNPPWSLVLREVEMVEREKSDWKDIIQLIKMKHEF